MFKRKREGSVICTSCGVLVGVNDPTCYNCGRRNPGLWGFAPALRSLGNDLGFVPIVTGGTIILYVLSLIMSRAGQQHRCSRPNSHGADHARRERRGSGVRARAGGGRVLTAGWLHGGILHIFFNVLWIRQLGPEIANLYGAGRMVIIYTIAGIAGFALSSVLGLLSHSVFRRRPDRRRVGLDLRLPRRAGALRPAHRQQPHRPGRAAVRAVHGHHGLHLRSGVDNAAHLGGFVGGYLASMILDPLKPERIDHIAIAVGCLVVTLVAIISSVITALPYLPLARS